VAEIDVKGHDVVVPPGVEAVFIALHGEFGEDGQIQALLNKKGVPYTGSGVEASRASFDKVISKELCAKAGIPMPEYEILGKGAKRSLSLPVVVKPACQGSSIGVHRVMSESDWSASVNDSLSYDKQVIVERYIPGRELTVGVVGHEALPVVEIVAPDGWYDYKAKYTKGASQYRVPAPLEEKTSRRCQELSVKVFDALGCRGMGRVDFRLSPEGDLYFLELNNIPGFTETSLLPKAAAQAGMSFSSLCDRIMKMARTD
jgi:D-alanine-D-alanine ligase